LLSSLPPKSSRFRAFSELSALPGDGREIRGKKEGAAISKKSGVSVSEQIPINRLVRSPCHLVILPLPF
jgi:hypothetical protein